MKIIKTKQYLKDLQKKIIGKHKRKEEETINKIIELMINCNTMKDLMSNPFSKVYNIEKKSGNLKEFYTARINQKLRLYIKPKGEYPYELEEIVEVNLYEIDDKHYGDG